MVWKEEARSGASLQGSAFSISCKSKKGSIKQAPLPKESPDWDEFSEMTWEQIEEGADANWPGFKVVRKLLTDNKLLTDKRFDR